MKKKFVEKNEEELILKNVDWFTRIIILKKERAVYRKLKN